MKNFPVILPMILMLIVPRTYNKAWYAPFPITGLPKLEGVWLAKDLKMSSIQISTSVNGIQTAKIIQSEKSGFLGKVLMPDIRFNDKLQSYSATLTPPDKNITVSATLTFVNENTLKVIGKKLFITKTFFWTRQ